MIDLKIGVRTWDAAALDDVRRSGRNRGGDGAKFGFKVCGERQRTRCVEAIDEGGVYQIRMSDNLTKETLLEFVRRSLSPVRRTLGFGGAHLAAARAGTHELPYRLVGTSLLVVYESGKLKRSGVAPCQDEWNGFCAKETKLEPRFGFCHAVLKPADQQVDENFEGGLKLFQRFVDSL